MISLVFQILKNKMNIEQVLEENMKEISAANGVCLSLVERFKLESTLDQVKAYIKCDEMLFLEIIYGAEKEKITKNYFFFEK